MAIDIGRAAYEKFQTLEIGEAYQFPWEELSQRYQDQFRELAVAVLDATTIDDAF